MSLSNISNSEMATGTSREIAVCCRIYWQMCSKFENIGLFKDLKRKYTFPEGLLLQESKEGFGSFGNAKL